MTPHRARRLVGHTHAGQGRNSLRARTRILTAAVGVPLVLAAGACNRGGYGSGYGDDPGTNAAAASTPPVTPEPTDAPQPAAAAQLQQPVGIPTDKLIATEIPKMGQ